MKSIITLNKLRNHSRLFGCFRPKAVLLVRSIDNLLSSNQVYPDSSGQPEITRQFSKKLNKLNDNEIYLSTREDVAPRHLSTFYSRFGSTPD